MIPFLALIPTPIKHALFATVVILSLSYWAYDHTWDKGHAAAVSEGLEATLASVEASRVREQQMQIKLQESHNEARKREVKMAAAAAGLRTERDGLQGDLAAAKLLLSKSSCGSVSKYAATLGDVFGQCAITVEGLAQAADRHSSDSLMLIQAWPK